jgi:hypothetical protein
MDGEDRMVVQELPTKRRKTFDSKCFDLAEHFLSDYGNVRHMDKVNLACDIQQAIEQFFEDYEPLLHDYDQSAGGPKA